MSPTTSGKREGTEGRDQTPNIFPFFELPREMRDNIYDECLEDQEGTVPHNLGVVVMKNSSTRLLPVSRQFKHEYQERARNRRSILFFDKGLTLNLIEYPLAPVFLDTRDITIILDYDDFRDFKMHQNWLPKFLRQMQSDASITVYWNTESAARFNVDREVKAISEFLSDVPPTTLYAGRRVGMPQMNGYVRPWEQSHGTPYLRYSTETGLWERM